MSVDPFQGVAFQSGRFYDMPSIYDLEFQAYVAEIPFYRAAFADAPGDGVFLELGAGTGRICLTLANEGARVHAVEPSAPMLDVLNERIAREGLGARVGVERAFAHDFVGDGVRARLVAFPFNTVVHIHTREALDAMFHHVHARCARDEAWFAFDYVGCAWGSMAVAGEFQWVNDDKVHALTGVRYHTRDLFEYHPARRILNMRTQFVADGEASGVEAVVELRMWTRQEVIASALGAGFRVHTAYGDVDLTRYDERAPRMMVVCVPDGP